MRIPATLWFAWLAKDAEPVLRQVLTVTLGVQEFVKTITKKHLQR